MLVLILEDESLAAERLQKLLLEIDPSIEIVQILKSVEASLKWFDHNDEPDLILSDIQLLDSLSFDIFSQREIKCPIIFTTAYDQYAMQAFEVNSVDYLLKPVQKEKLSTALEKFNAQQSGAVVSHLTPDDIEKIALMVKNRQPEYKSRFLVKLGQKIRAIPIEKIAYFFTKDKLTFLVTNTGDKYPLDNSLEEIDQLLDPNIFFRLNRKFVTKINAVKEIHPYFKGRLKIELSPPIDNDIVISSDKTPSFKKWLDK